MLTYKVQPKGAVSPGMNTCQGCMIDVIFRNALDVLGDDTVLVIPPGCAAQFSGCGPEASVTVPGIQGNLENSAALATGIANGFSDVERVVVAHALGTSIGHHLDVIALDAGQVNLE